MNKEILNFQLMITPNQVITSQALHGKNVVLYFYPKDSTQVAHLKVEILLNYTLNLNAPILRFLVFRVIVLNLMLSLKPSVIYLLI